MEVFNNIPGYKPSFSNSVWRVRETIIYEGIEMVSPTIIISQIIENIKFNQPSSYYVGLKFSWENGSYGTQLSIEKPDIESIDKELKYHIPEIQFIIQEKDAHFIINYIKKAKDYTYTNDEIFEIYKSKSLDIQFIQVKNFERINNSLNFIGYDNILLNYKTKLKFGINEI